MGVGRWSGGWASRVYGGNTRSQRLRDQKTVISSSKSEKGFKITVKVLYAMNGSMMELKARRLPYLESSLITRGGPRSVLAATALRLR
ncbi:MAG: hypothetical protein ABSB81_11775 [Halobacteriota archaeon]